MLNEDQWLDTAQALHAEIAKQVVKAPPPLKLRPLSALEVNASLEEEFDLSDVDDLEYAEDIQVPTAECMPMPDDSPYYDSNGRVKYNPSMWGDPLDHVIFRFTDAYTVDRVLMNKRFRKVYRARRVTDDKPVVIICVADLISEHVRGGIPREIRLMKALEGVNHIAQLLEWCPIDPFHYVMVVEYHPNCDLVTSTYGDVYTIRMVMKQLLTAVASIHKRRISHRDLSMQNVLWDASRRHLVVIDLESGSFFHPNGYYHRTGHDGYDAPEKIQVLDMMSHLSSRHPRVSRRVAGYTEAADMYSVGIIFWMLLQSETEPPTPSVVQKWIRSAHSQQKQSRYLEVDLVLRLLRRDPAERITAADALNHEFFRRDYPKQTFRSVKRLLRVAERESEKRKIIQRELWADDVSSSESSGDSSSSSAISVKRKSDKTREVTKGAPKGKARSGRDAKRTSPRRTRRSPAAPTMREKGVSTARSKLSDGKGSSAQGTKSREATPQEATSREVTSLDTKRQASKTKPATPAPAREVSRSDASNSSASESDRSESEESEESPSNPSETSGSEEEAPKVTDRSSRPDGDAEAESEDVSEEESEASADNETSARVGVSGLDSGVVRPQVGTGISEEKMGTIPVDSQAYQRLDQQTQRALQAIVGAGDLGRAMELLFGQSHPIGLYDEDVTYDSEEESVKEEEEVRDRNSLVSAHHDHGLVGPVISTLAPWSELKEEKAATVVSDAVEITTVLSSEPVAEIPSDAEVAEVKTPAPLDGVVDLLTTPQTAVPMISVPIPAGEVKDGSNQTSENLGSQSPVVISLLPTKDRAATVHRRGESVYVLDGSGVLPQLERWNPFQSMPDYTAAREPVNMMEPHAPASASGSRKRSLDEDRSGKRARRA